ncbi:WYL domain-containing protein [Aliivibrio fischeri]|uniref:WYL domain-containing protein n=1 Tax=Aliivibrio fischeri TaxID=668 RepID=UPI0012D966F3|nr:WYL domain-containing protein [Aliivibrio fischeri]MUK60696.1 WYL domain-containing protein [Aliivibrio fischeri]MUL20798.1 WYL domain-containing protein [Aliivibrio fischeri]MUL24573.1 WYL domain-containing protein [Aliivibrio fischeri]
MTAPLTYSELQATIGANAERMAFIDFRLKFTGQVKRIDLNQAFNLADAASSRMLSIYKELRPKNIVHDKAKKVNVINADTFSPLVDLKADTALNMLAHGFDKSKLIDNPSLPYARIGMTTSNVLDVEDVSQITRAISGEHAVTCNYISARSPKHEQRTLVPLSIFFDGRTWMFRAYDRSQKDSDPTKSSFKNFTFCRAKNIAIPEGDNKLRHPYEEIKDDSAWNLSLPLLLQLHPKLTSESEKAAIRTDFGIPADQDELILTEKAAFLFLLAKQWHIDTKENENDESYYKFKLKNLEMIRPYL